MALSRPTGRNGRSAQQPYPPILLRQAPGNLRRVVFGAVVQDEDFKMRILLRLQPTQARCDVLCLITHRQADRDEGMAVRKENGRLPVVAQIAENQPVKRQDREGCSQLIEEHPYGSRRFIALQGGVTTSPCERATRSPRRRAVSVRAASYSGLMTPGLDRSGVRRAGSRRSRRTVSASRCASILRSRAETKARRSKSASTLTYSRGRTEINASGRFSDQNA